MLEDYLNYHFKDKALLQRALTHRSITPKNSNERLEFLGDSILSFVISKYLFHKNKHFSEGDLSRIRSSLVKKETLYALSQKIHLEKFLKTTKNEKKNNKKGNDSLLADAFEAIIGAIFLDSDIETCEKYILAIYEDDLANLPSFMQKDPKSQLQEFLQKHQLALPSYEIIATKGLTHNQTFEVRCHISDLGLTTVGIGKSKQEAEFLAAKAILEKLNQI